MGGISARLSGEEQDPMLIYFREKTAGRAKPVHGEDGRP